MLAYAPTRNAPSARPGTLALIVGGHAAIVALALAATFEADRRPPPPRTDIYDVDLPPPPAEPVPPAPTPPISQLDLPQPVVRPLTPPPFATEPAFPTLPPAGPVAGTAATPPEIVQPAPVIADTRPVLRTSGADLRPPYPDSRRMSGEEARLKLRLSIDAGGRVVAVEPVGAADRAFLESARRHILRRWRYQPATEGGRPVAATVTVTLRFELDG